MTTRGGLFRVQTKEENINSINNSNFKTMENKQSSGEYLAPNVKVVEVKVQNHILQTSLDDIPVLPSAWDE